MARAAKLSKTGKKACRRDAARPAKGGDILFCAAWSRAWWALLLARCAGGEPVHLLVQRARAGKGWGCGVADKPDEAAIAALSSHRGDSDHFEAWRRWLARRGAHIDRKPATTWVWLPGDPPPCEPEKPVPDSIRDGTRFPAQSTAKSPPPDG